jgi:hypothetical protein
MQISRIRLSDNALQGIDDQLYLRTDKAAIIYGAGAAWRFR